MKNKFKLLLFSSILILIVGTPNTNAEDTNLFGRPNAISFKGENQNWFVLHRMYLKGTEIEYDTKIKYKGDNGKLRKSISLHYLITNKAGGHGGAFTLKNSNVFQSERMFCGGCKYLDKEKEVKLIIDIYGDYEESLILKRE